MGTTRVTVTIRNPADPTRSWEGLFRVDTSIADSVVPRLHLEAIGLKPEGQRVYELVDDRKVEMDMALARIEFMGGFTGGVVLFGDAGAKPLLGLTALESVGIEVDPTNQRLKKRPAVRLKEANPWRIGSTEPPALSASEWYRQDSGRRRYCVLNPSPPARRLW